jgi:hypothetical protein
MDVDIDDEHFHGISQKATNKSPLKSSNGSPKKEGKFHFG